MYTGPYKRPEVNDIEKSDDYLTSLVPDVFVAVHISNYKKTPVIGKAVDVMEDTFAIHYWKGTYNSSWEPLFVKQNGTPTPWTDTIPKQSVILCAFQLDEHRNLQDHSWKYLKKCFGIKISGSSQTNMFGIRHSDSEFVYER